MSDTAYLFESSYISPFVFTQTLIPLLQQTAREPASDVRIVNVGGIFANCGHMYLHERKVSSITHKLIPASVNFNDFSDFNVTYRWRLLPGLYRYGMLLSSRHGRRLMLMIEGHSKFMITLWTKTLQRRLNEDSTAPITALSIHPGGVDTYSHKWVFPRFFKFLVGLAIAHPVVGAYNSAFAAASKRIHDNKHVYQGVYLESQPTGKIVPMNKAASDEELGNRLWALTVKFLEGIDLPCGTL